MPLVYIFARFDGLRWNNSVSAGGLKLEFFHETLARFPSKWESQRRRPSFSWFAFQFTLGDQKAISLFHLFSMTNIDDPKGLCKRSRDILLSYRQRKYCRCRRLRKLSCIYVIFSKRDCLLSFSARISLACGVLHFKYQLKVHESEKGHQKVSIFSS